MTVTKQSVSLAPEIQAQIQARVDATRGAFSAVIGESLDRYFEALRRARARLVGQFSGGELALIADSSNGTLWSAASIPLLYANVEDSLDDGLAAKWEVDGPALVNKLRGLSYIESAAIVDAVERWWAQDDPRPDFADILKTPR